MDTGDPDLTSVTIVVGLMIIASTALLLVTIISCICCPQCPNYDKSSTFYKRTKGQWQAHAFKAE